jgi:hypothetical protein
VISSACTRVGRRGGYGCKAAVEQQDSIVYKSLFGTDVGLKDKRNIAKGGMYVIVSNNTGNLQGLLLNMFKGETE